MARLSESLQARFPECRHMYQQSSRSERDERNTKAHVLHSKWFDYLISLGALDIV